MKNTIFLMLCALLFTATVNAQTTVDSIAAKYKLLPMPEALTIEKAFPVIGTYQLDAEAGTEVTIALDENNKGIIWIEGLPVGKIKAYLKQSPSTYRIVAQKSESGQQVAEGTLIFDKETNVLQVALGKSFNEADPSAIFAAATTTTEETEVKPAVKNKTAKKAPKAKVVYYTATKVQAAVQQDEATTSL